MKRSLVLALTFAATLLIAPPALAGDDPIQTFAEGCEKELKTYCKDVTPGEGRILACLYAHSDKISVQVSDWAVIDPLTGL